MIYLAIFILLFTTLQFLVALVNLVSETHLPRSGQKITIPFTFGSQRPVHVLRCTYIS
jgi:hypothetical protein